MAEIDGLVSVLSAHLNKVERDESGKRKLLLGERDDGDHCPSCGSWIESVHEGKFEYCGCAPPEEWWVPAGDERVLGLVRATRDLIGQWRAACDSKGLTWHGDAVLAAEMTQADTARREAVRDALEAALSAVARGWGVVDNEEAD